MNFLCASDALPEGTSRLFAFHRLSVFGIRRQGQAYLYRNRCPHRGIGLNGAADASLLDSSGQLIECAHHGALFLVESGECIAGPCEGEWLEALLCHEDEQGVWFSRPAAPADVDQ